jgi:hypothetical protein
MLRHDYALFISGGLGASEVMGSVLHTYPILEGGGMGGLVGLVRCACGLGENDRWDRAGDGLWNYFQIPKGFGRVLGFEAEASKSRMFVHRSEERLKAIGWDVHGYELGGAREFSLQVS